MKCMTIETSQGQIPLISDDHRSFGLCRRLVGERVEVEERSASAKPTLMMHTTYERMAYVTRNRNRVSELKQLRGREELLKG